MAQLDSDSGYERGEAQEEIERRGRDGVKALRAALAAGRVGVRGRLHAVWVLAHVEGAAAVEELLGMAKADADARVQAQAVRAVADLADPVLARHRLDAGPGDADLAARLAALAPGKEPRVLLEVTIALGRLRWADAPGWLPKVLTKPDPALAHAAMQALRRSGNWPAVLKLLDRPSADPVRALALRAVADQAVPQVADGLVERLRDESDPARRREVADALTRIHLIESILQPSRTVAPGFQTVAVTLKDGRVLTGVKVADAGDAFTLADAEGRKQAVAKSAVEEERPQPTSVMPEGLEKPFTVDEFVDLIAFLASLKDDRPR